MNGTSVALIGIGAAAVECPIVRSEVSADDATALRICHRPQRNVRFPGAQVSRDLPFIELDHDFRMLLVQLAEHRREEHRVNVLGRELHGAAEVTRAGGGDLGKLLS